MTRRSRLPFAATAVATALACTFPIIAARAADGMSAAEFMKAANTNGDKTLSLEEVDAYARKRFAAIESDNDKTLNDKELKGRLSNAGMVEADTDKDKSVDEKEFVDYAKKLFTEADVTRKAGADHATLSEKELETSAGKKLIELLH